MAAAAATVIVGYATASLAAEPRTPPSAAVTVLRVKKSCFDDAIELTGILVPRQEYLVRPDREGYQITQVLVEPGDTVTSGQTLARLTPLDPQMGGVITVTSPAAGVVGNIFAAIGTTASAKAPMPLFQIIDQGELELQAEVSAKQLTRLSANQTAKFRIVGAGDMTGKVRSVSTAVDPMTQLGQVRLSVTDSKKLKAGTFGRVNIIAGQRCGVAVPLSAVMYGPEGAVVQTVRGDRVETRRVTVGLLSQAEAEIREGLSDGDIVVARAGAFLREGDHVKPINPDSPGRK
jgi:HlyD family secretion protein